MPDMEGPVQQKGRTGNAVVKSGKLYMVKRHVYRRCEGCTPKPEGRRLETVGNGRPREMIRISLRDTESGLQACFYLYVV